MPRIARSAGPIAALGALLAACAARQPADATPPALPFAPPSAWDEVSVGTPLAADAAPNRDATLGLEPWWSAFRCPELDAAEDEALARHPELAVAAAEVMAAAAQARAVAGARMPQLGADLDLARSRRNFIGLPIPGAPEVLPITSNQFGLGLQLSWELDLWSRLGAAAEAAVRDSQALAADRRALALAISGQVARTWLVLTEQTERLELLEARAALAARRLALAQRRLAAGTGPAAAVPAASAAFAAASAALEQERGSVGATRSHWCALRGRYPEADAAAAPFSPLPALPDPVPAGLPAELLARRPDLAAAGFRAVAARARTAQAQAELLPRIELTAGAGTTAADLADLLNGDFRVWSLAGNVFAPIFAGGRLRAQADAALAAATAAESLYVSRALTAFAEVESALAAEQALRAAAERLTEAAAALDAEAARAQRRFAAGTGDANEVLEAEDRALAARAAANAARLALLLNRVDLHLALGGSFAAPAAP